MLLEVDNTFLYVSTHWRTTYLRPRSVARSSTMCGSSAPAHPSGLTHRRISSPRPSFDSAGRLVGIDDNQKRMVTPDGYAVNTDVVSFSSPHNPKTPVDH